MFSPSPRHLPARGSRPLPVPSVHLRPDHASDDMHRLTVEIDRVLSGQPPSVWSQQQSLSAALAAAGGDIDRSLAGVSTFDREPTGHRAEGVVDQAAGWLGRARRERRIERARSAISWTVVALSVGCIAGASAFMVRGGLWGPDIVERAVRLIGL
jgi:hypothetical protein